MPDTVIDINKFSGLNARETPGRIKDEQLFEVINYDLGREGELTKRTGFTEKFAGGGTLGANQIVLLGFFNDTVVTQLIAKSDDDLFYSTDGGVTWTAFPGNPYGDVQFGVQYLNKFYLVRSTGTLIQWDGAVATAIAGSPFGTHARIHKDRLYIINTVGSSTINSRLYFSKPGDLSATGWVSTNFIDINPGDGDYLVASYNIQDNLYLFKSKSIWTLYTQSDPSLWVLRNFNLDIGCISKYSIREFEGVLYFLSVKGVNYTDGNLVRSLSEDILSFFNQQVVTSTSLNKSSAAIWDDKYILMLEYFPTAPTWNSLSTQTWNQLLDDTWSSISAQYVYLVFHFRSKGWTKWLPSGTMKPHIFVEIDVTSSLRGLYSGDRLPTGKIFKFGDPIYQDNLINFECVLETKDFDFEDVTELKRGKWLAVEQVGAGDHSISLIPNGNTLVSHTVPGDSNRRVFKIPGPGRFRTLRLRGSSITANPLSFFGITLHASKKKKITKSGAY